MSHDRGCWKCHKDVWDYANCTDTLCPKKPKIMQLTLESAIKERKIPGLKIVVVNDIMLVGGHYELRSGNGKTILTSNDYTNHTDRTRAAKKLAKDLGLFCYEVTGYTARNSQKLNRI